MEIRKALKKDNSALLELSRLAPMIGVVDAYVDPSPDFFEFVKLQGDNPVLWISEEEGDVLGCVAVSHREVRYKGEIVTRGYGSELKVHPKSRGKKIGLHLATQFVKKSIEQNDDLAEVMIIGGNMRSLKVADKMHGEQSHAGYAKAFQLMPYKKYHVDPTYTIRVATESDIPDIKKVLHETYKDYAMSPLFDKNALDKELSVSKSFTISNFRVAEKDGKIVACGAFWDQSSFRRTIVTRISGSMKAALFGLNIIRPIFKFPRPPKENESLKYLYFRFPGVIKGEENALRSLLHHESNEIRGLKKYHFIWAGFHQADPLMSVVSDMWKMSMDVNVIHLNFKDKIHLYSEKEYTKQPVYIDFAIV